MYYYTLKLYDSWRKLDDSLKLYGPTIESSEGMKSIHVITKKAIADLKKHKAKIEKK